MKSMQFIKCGKCGFAWLYEGTGSRAACPKCNYSIYLQSPRLTRPRFLLEATPAEIMAMKPEDRHDLAYFYIDSWNGHLTIGSAIYAEDGWHARVRLISPKEFGLSTDDLVDAMAEAGASIDASGMFSLNDRVRAAVRAVMEAEGCP